MAQRIGKFWDDQRGAVAPLFALSLTALIAVGGIAFDYARLAAMDTELQNAADQAALAAATQLDGQPGACDRAIAAARDLLKRNGQAADETGNFTFFSSDPDEPSVTIAAQGAAGTECAVLDTDPVRFYTTADGSVPAADDSEAKFVEIRTDARTARYALTPVVSLMNSDAIDATARAGLGSAICKIPPLMICNPEPDEEFDADNKRGWGIRVTGHGNDKGGSNGNISTWSPGGFGFLEAGTGSNADLKKALAFQNPALSCLQVETGEVNTGNPQGLYDAINTRFDIYDFPSGGGTTLAACFTGSCPAAPNVVKDLIKIDTNVTGKRCQLHESLGGQANSDDVPPGKGGGPPADNGKKGWQLPETGRRFWPRAFLGNDNAGQTGISTGTVVFQKAGDPIDAMGLTRDLCHYDSYGQACANDDNNRFGNGKWARKDYFNKYHSGHTLPGNAGSITRYETYLWELAMQASITNFIPHNVTAKNPFEQYGRPICSTGTLAEGQDRRVLSVAVVDNCSELNGGSRTADIGEWVDMFLVEPTVDGRGNGSNKDMIYMEIIGKSRAAGNGSVAAQTTYRSSPYLVR
jgi:Flp pilus assembly protein TadG